MIVAGDDVTDVEACCVAYAAGLSGFGGSVVLRLDGNTRVRCGNRAMGYSLFYGIWEFFYEKVVFFF